MFRQVFAQKTIESDELLAILCHNVRMNHCYKHQCSNASDCNTHCNFVKIIFMQPDNNTKINYIFCETY